MLLASILQIYDYYKSVTESTKMLGTTTHIQAEIFQGLETDYILMSPPKDNSLFQELKSENVPLTPQKLPCTLLLSYLILVDKIRPPQ